MVAGPFKCVVAVVEGGRIRVLGCQTVVDRDPDQAELGAPPIKQRRVHVVVAEYETTAMDSDDRWREAQLGRPAGGPRTGTAGSPPTTRSVLDTDPDRTMSLSEELRTIPRPSRSAGGRT